MIEQAEITVTREIVYKHETKQYIYSYLIYDTFLVGQVNIVAKDTTLHICGLSTINFKDKGQNSIELADFEPHKAMYAINRAFIEKKGINCKGIGTEILADMILEAKIQEKNTIELTAIPTAYGFYNKVCKQFLEQGLIKDFSMSHKYELTISI